MTIRVCKDDRYECYEEEFTTNQTGEQRITKTVKHLTPGSKYTGTVFFTSNGTESEGETKNFITEASMFFSKEDNSEADKYTRFPFKKIKVDEFLMEI